MNRIVRIVLGSSFLLGLMGSPQPIEGLQKDQAFQVDNPCSASLRTYIDSGKLDIGRNGEFTVDAQGRAFIVVDTSDIDERMAAEKERERSETDSSLVLSRRAAGYSERKLAVLGSLPGIRMTEDYRHLPVSLVDFSDCDALLGVLRVAQVSNVRLGVAVEPLQARHNVELVRPVSAQMNSFLGADRTIAILDTPLDNKLDEFCRTSFCRVTKPLPQEPCVRDTPSHGDSTTFVAMSVAPKIPIVSLVVMPCVPPANPAVGVGVLMSALNWLIASRDEYKTVAANLSFTTVPQKKVVESACESGPVPEAIERVLWAGISVVVSSGNIDNAFGRPGGSTLGVLQPACVPGVIAVGSVHSKLGGLLDDQCLFLKHIGPCGPDDIGKGAATGALVTVLAPGVALDTTALGSAVPFAGTSAAAPHVTAAISLLKTAERETQKDLSVSDVKRVIVDSGRLIQNERDRDIWKPRLDIDLALRMVRDTCRIEPLQNGQQPKHELTKNTCYSRLMGTAHNAALYSFVSDRRQTVKINVETPSYAWTPRVSVTGPDGSDWVRISARPLLSSRNRAFVEFEAEAGQRYLVEITSAQPNCTGQFDLLASTVW